MKIHQIYTFSMSIANMGASTVLDVVVKEIGQNFDKNF
jgi:hypothetical protein